MNEETKEQKWSPITWGCIVFGLFAVLAAFVLPCFIKSRNFTAPNGCINNLRMIDSAKESWALAKQKTNGEDVVTSEVNAYIRGNTTPVCPAGGTYSYNVVGSNPTCTITNPTIHRLPESE
jgi:hypothetical protein